MAIKTNIFSKGISEAKQSNENLRAAGDNFKKTVDNAKQSLDEAEFKTKVSDMREKMKTYYDEAGDDNKKDGDAFNKKVDKYKEMMLNSSSNSLIKKALNEEMHSQNLVYQANIGKINEKLEDKKNKEIDYRFIQTNMQSMEQFINTGQLEKAEELRNQINETVNKDSYSTEYKIAIENQSKKVFTNTVVKATAKSTVDFFESVLNKEVEFNEPLKMLLDDLVGSEKVNELVRKELVTPEDLELISYRFLEKLDNPTEENEKYFNLLGLTQKDGILFANNGKDRVNEEHLNAIRNEFKEAVDGNLNDFKIKHSENLEKASNDINTVTKIVENGGILDDNQILMILSKHGKYVNEDQKNQLSTIAKIQNQNNISFEEKNKEDFYNNRYDDENTKQIAKTLEEANRVVMHQDPMAFLKRNNKNEIGEIDFKSNESLISTTIKRFDKSKKMQKKYNTDGSILSKKERTTMVERYTNSNNKEKALFIKEFNEKNPEIFKKVVKEMFLNNGEEIPRNLINSASIIEQKGEYSTVNKILTGETILKENEKIWSKSAENDLSFAIQVELEGVFGVAGTTELSYKKEAMKNHIITQMTQDGITDYDNSKVDIEKYFKKAQEEIVGKTIIKKGTDNEGNAIEYKVLLPNLKYNEEEFNKNIGSLSPDAINYINKPFIGHEKVIEGLQQNKLRLVKVNVEDYDDNLYNVYVGDNALASEENNDYVLMLSNTDKANIYQSYDKISDYYTQNKITDETQVQIDTIRLSFSKKIENMSKIIDTIDKEISVKTKELDRTQVNLLKKLRETKLKEIKNMEKQQKESLTGIGYKEMSMEMMGHIY